MRAKWMHTVLILVGWMAMGSGAGLAQTDVAASLYGAFSGTTDGNDTTQSPSNAAGGLLEVRHISNPLIGYEGTYSLNRANEVYRPNACPATGITPSCNPTTPVSANAHEVTADWVVSLKIKNFRPFGLTGGGLLFNEPSSGQANTSSSTKAVYVYGAGLDWRLVPHMGLRFQYRGNLYKAPDLSSLFTSTNKFTHTAEPMIGAFFRF
jgi:opacity protein-like surface antigen